MTRPRNDDDGDDDRRSDSPRPGVYRVRYGPGTARDLPVAVDDVLACAGLEAVRREVWSLVDLEQVDRLADETPFVVVVPVADGRLRLTEGTVTFERR
jgi:hypothetical protein